MVKAGDGLLKLGIQHRAVGHNDHRVEDGPVLVVVKAGQTVGRPGDGIGLPGACAVLHQIIFAGAIGSDILDQLPHHIHLVIPGKDDGLLGDLLLGAVLLGDFLFLHLEADKLLENVQQAVLLQYVFPEVGGHIVPIRGRRISRPSVPAGAVAALVEGEKVGLAPVQFGGHHRFVEVHSKEHQDAVV